MFGSLSNPVFVSPVPNFPLFCPRALCAFALIGSLQHIYELCTARCVIFQSGWDRWRIQQLTENKLLAKQHRKLRWNNRAMRINVWYEEMKAERSSSDEEFFWVLTTTWMIYVGMWLKVYSAVGGHSAPVCIRERLEKLRWTWPSSFSTSINTADVFTEQSRAQRRAHAMSSAVLGEWHSKIRRADACVLLSSCRWWVQTQICLFVCRCVFVIVLDKIEAEY